MLDNKVMQSLRQRMEVVVSTFYRIYGSMPSVEELAYELGEEFAPVLSEYCGAVSVLAG